MHCVTQCHKGFIDRSSRLVVHPALKLAEGAVGGTARIHHDVHEGLLAIVQHHIDWHTAARCQRNLPKLKVPRCVLTLADEVFSVVELDRAVFLLEDGLQLVVQVGERHRVGRHDLRTRQGGVCAGLTRRPSGLIRARAALDSNKRPRQGAIGPCWPDSAALLKPGAAPEKHSRIDCACRLPPEAAGL